MTDAAHNKSETAFGDAVKTVSHDELKRAIRAAARWYAVLQSPSVTPADHQGWQAWMLQHASHPLAWREVEQVQASFTRVPGEIALPALRDAAISRRELLRRLGIVVVATPMAATAWRLKPWLGWQAEYTTGTGEQHSLTLVDGGKLILNTASAVDVDYSADARLIQLHRGEIYIETAPDSPAQNRPFLVATPHGSIQALGTRFIVSLDGHHTTVTVLEKIVRISPTAGGEQRDLESGQQLRFTSHSIAPTVSAGSYAGSWLNRSLTVVDMPLRELLAELSRYRRGILSCSDDVAGLKISGAFPLDDTDRALDAITRAFPVQERRWAGYWVRLTGV